MEIAALLDTNVILNAKNSSEPHSAYSMQLLDAVEDGAMLGIISVVSIAEICTGYYTQGDKKGKDELLAHMITTRGFVISDLDVELADSAARIRSDTGLRLPDAIIIATALAKGAHYLVTNDRGLKKAGRYIEVLSSKEMANRLRHAKKR